MPADNLSALLGEVEAALAKATPGPWRLADGDVWTDHGYVGTIDHDDAALIVLLRNHAEALLSAARRAEGVERAALPATLLPLAAGLLRDAEAAIVAHAGPGQHVGTPKVTVDATRLRNVAREVCAAIRSALAAGKGEA